MSTVTILDIQRMSSEDGPGLRTTAFLKGCPLACRWCHNPESIAFHGEVLWHPQRCIACESCPASCPQKGLHFTTDGVEIEHDRCTGCFACCEACPAGALEQKGTEYDCEALARELLKDRSYFGAEGGVTLSGGEALMQEGTLELLRILKENGAHTALDTCGLVPRERFCAALQYTDIVLFDVKLADSARHKAWTAAGNETILENLKIVADWVTLNAHSSDAGGPRCWIRTPIIPGATDDEANIQGIGEILAQYPGAFERWELCAFNNLCAGKYESMGRTWEFKHAPLKTKAELQALEDIAKRTGACAHTRWTGAAQS